MSANVIKENLVYFCGRLVNLDNVLLNLEQGKILLTDECEDVKSFRTTKKRNEELLHVLLKKDLNGEKWKFVKKVFYNTGNQHLACKMEEIAPTHSCTPSTLSLSPILENSKSRTENNTMDFKSIHLEQPLISVSGLNGNLINLNRLQGSTRQKVMMECRTHFEGKKIPTAIQEMKSRLHLSDKKSVDSISFAELLKQDYINVKPEWETLFGDKIAVLSILRYNTLESIYDKADTMNEKGNIIASTLPYILQNIKMWACNILVPEQLSKILSQLDNSVDEDSENEKESKDETNEENPNDSFESQPILNKIDLFTYLLVATNVYVLADIFRIIVNFPIALPLILPDCRSSSREKYIQLVPAFQKCSIKWENEEKGNGLNFLFKSPFVLITAFRVGHNDQKAGKSTFLNQIFNNPDTFHWQGQAGQGKSTTVNGTVEFIWLTKDTCKTSVWDAIEKEMKASHKNEIVLLANIHGDISDHLAILEALVGISSKFIAFNLPKHRENKSTNFAKIQKICGGDSIKHLYVDNAHKTTKAYEKLQSISPHNHEVLQKLTRCIANALKTRITEPRNTSIPVTPGISSYMPIETNKSSTFLSLIKEMMKDEKTTTIKEKVLLIQKMKTNEVSRYHDEWEKNANLRKLITTFAEIFLLPVNERHIAICHIEVELAILSDSTSKIISDEIAKRQTERANNSKDEHNNSKQSSDNLNEIEGHIKRLQKELNRYLTLEDFVRELSLVYEMMMIFQSDNNIALYSNLQNQFTELLIEGIPMEILDGERGRLPEIWVQSVCRAVNSRLPNLRIFVVSILGMQSTGKSTLLNCLFGCKFATSVGKCTRGLYMRLILLEPSYRDELGLDAVIVIDTEGLGSPQSMTDKKSSKRDRAMATYAMSISDLTLVNVAGETYQEIVTILQIVIITMAKMDETGIHPDLLLVQRVTEGGQDAKLSSGVDNFCNALKEAHQLIQDDKNNSPYKRAAEENFRILERRIKDKTVLCQLRAFKSGASPQAPPTEEYTKDAVSLRKRILQEYQSRKKVRYFCTWYTILTRYWKAVQQQKIAQFNNIQQAQEFIHLISKMDSIKTEFTCSLNHHLEILQKYIIEETKKRTVDGIFEIALRSDIERCVEEHLHFVPLQCGVYPVLPDKIIKDPCENCKAVQYVNNELTVFIKDATSSNSKEAEANISSYFDDEKKVVVEKMMRFFNSLKLKHETPTEFDKMLKQILASKTKGVAHGTIEDVWLTLLTSVKNLYPIAEIRGSLKLSIIGAYKTDVGQHLDLTDEPKLDSSNAKTVTTWTFRKKDTYLSTHEHKWINSAINMDIEIVTKNCKTTDPKIVSVFKTTLRSTFQKLQKQFNITLTKSFKSQAKIYALRLFLREVVERHNESIRETNKFFILERQKKDYVEKIKYYMEIDISNKVTEVASTIVQKLLHAARIISIEITLSETLKHFKKLEVGPEEVRIHFFISLAVLLKNSKTNEALEYFLHPRKTITNWYIKWIENYIKDDLEPLVAKLFKIECDDIENRIDEVNTKEGLSKVVNAYLFQVEHYYISEMLSSEKSELKLELKKQFSEAKLFFQLEITDSDIQPHYDNFMANLGCTESCPNCGAICFGTKNHENNLSPYNNHFTCHQPRGLMGALQGNHELVMDSCCTTDTDPNSPERKTFNENFRKKDVNQNFRIQEGANWKKNQHPVEEYNLIMEWMFLRVNHKLARHYQALPASRYSLESKGFDKLEEKILNILSVLANNLKM